MSDALALALAEAARSLIGIPFRPGGRDPHSGLDCFGVLDVALRAIGIEPVLPQRYRQRKLALPDLPPWLAANRLKPAGASGPASIRAGDVMLLQCGPAQPHCVVMTPGGFVHAHAGLRRVVESPGAPRDPTICHARLIGAARTV